MEHLAAISQFLVPILVALIVWMLRQALYSLRRAFDQNIESHQEICHAIQCHDQRLTRVETQIEQAQMDLNHLKHKECPHESR